MTETDATQRPISMPTKFIPYLDKYRIYRMFKDMLQDLVLNLPRDHLKHCKFFFRRHRNLSRDTDRIMILISPELKIDIIKLMKGFKKALGYFIITRRLVMDKYEMHDDYVPGCLDPALMSIVTKSLVLNEAVQISGWLMFDHPCTVREARCLQQDGVLPNVTLLLIPPPVPAPPTQSAQTPARGFFEQDFEGLKYCYKATLQEVIVNPEDDEESIVTTCFNAIMTSTAGLQGAGQGFNLVGSPTVYRVLVIGPRGSGRKTQGQMLAEHFGLVFLNYDDLELQAMARDDELGMKMRTQGVNVQCKVEIVRRRITQKDCLDYGYVLTAFPMTEAEFESIDNMENRPNRIIILNLDIDTCRERALKLDKDWIFNTKGGVQHVTRAEKDINNELNQYFSEGIAELRAAAGVTALDIHIEPDDPPEKIQPKLQAAVIMAPNFDMITSTFDAFKNVNIDGI